ncbi:MAG: hypothetical protein GDYSWBUE_000502 [Candidatus Fervidibacterota bacterium]
MNFPMESNPIRPLRFERLQQSCGANCCITGAREIPSDASHLMNTEQQQRSVCHTPRPISQPRKLPHKAQLPVGAN